MSGALPLTLTWRSTPQPGRVLFVAFAYHGADRDGQPHGVLERRESPSARGHRIVHRDHYANPRTLAYLAGMIGRAIEQLSAAAPDLVIDSRCDAALPDGFAALFAAVESADIASAEAWQSGLLARLDHYDHIVLVYPDALGLGCGIAEQQALDRHASVIVINGRRRAFRIDGTVHHQLAFHRFLAHTRIVERVLAVVMRRVGATLASRDRRTAASHD
jgi:hypothetical protein